MKLHLSGKAKKRAAWIIVALIVANEIRGLLFVVSILWAWTH